MNPGRIGAGTNQLLREAIGTRVFWVLAGTFFICGLSTAGIINTHFIPFCGDNGIVLGSQPARINAPDFAFSIYATSSFFVELAADEGRLEEYRRVAAFNRHCGVDVHEISPIEVGDLFPYARTDDLLAGFYVPQDGRANPVDVTMALAKFSATYANSILANAEATEHGYDEALLLDSQGFVSEGAGENVFVVKDGVIYTPDLSAGALNGITRNTVLHIAKDLGIEVVQKRITRDEIYIADEAFFTGTAAEVTPIRELDRIEIGAGSRGPITEKIQNAFFDIVNGRNPKYAHWLTKV